jgi:hypothetical protein
MIVPMLQTSNFITSFIMTQAQVLEFLHGVTLPQEIYAVFSMLPTLDVLAIFKMLPVNQIVFKQILKFVLKVEAVPLLVMLAGIIHGKFFQIFGQV